MVYRLLLLPFLLMGMAAVDPKLKTAIELLGQTKAGAAELKMAKDLDIPIDAGKVSKTDITATRKSGSQPEEFKFATEVTIAEDKEPVFQALDLAHELVHAVHPKSNPFDPNLDATTYVKHGIEGEGGEAEAIAEECEVGKELTDAQIRNQMKNDTLQMIKARCQFVWNLSENPQKWKKSFYFLGQYYHEFMQNVLSLALSQETKNEWIKTAVEKSPVFSSAVAHKPYPLALLEEYVAITHKVCDRAKMSLGRSISSVPLLKDRCVAIGIDLSHD